ncbi:MAG TPA: multicopper oxidase domain-containing protein [Candidatus Babeliales bacterium]|nr:multicopper oxidase domain-containing protein [Candidatus Babeliales bacterium]
MRRRLVAFVVVCAWLAGCGGRASGPTSAMPQLALPLQGVKPSASNLLPEPPVVRAVNGVATVQLDVDLNSVTGQPQFVFNGMPDVAPTIDINPGETFVVDVKNELPKVPPPASPELQEDVNLHFHGLGVSPLKPGDDVLTVLAKPGERLHYVIHVPKNQEPGLYWYHPHVHGEVNYQVGESGMSGAIVVEGLARHLPELAKMKQRLIIVRATGIGADDPDAVKMDDMSAMDNASSDNASSDSDSESAQPLLTNPAPCTTKDGLKVSLNGVSHPDITISPGERQFFRVLNATGHKTLALNIEGEKVEVVAIDGFALDTYPGTPPTLTEATVVIPPAGRAEFVVTGPASGRAKLRTLCYNTGPNGDPDPNLWLGDLVSPKDRQDGGDFTTGPLRAGEPLPLNAYTAALPPPAAKRLVVLSENSKPRFFINGQSFSIKAPPMFVVHVGTVEEWHIVNVTQEIHDFHIHQLHFLIENVNGVKQTHPHWADTIIVPHRSGTGKKSVPGSVVLLMDFRDPVIRGEFVFHCHILDHEDQGMMAKIEAI